MQTCFWLGFFFIKRAPGNCTHINLINLLGKPLETVKIRINRHTNRILCGRTNVIIVDGINNFY